MSDNYENCSYCKTESCIVSSSGDYKLDLTKSGKPICDKCRKEILEDLGDDN